MKNNKLYSALLVLLVCLSLVVSVSAADSANVESPLTYTVEASASTVKPGDTVTVTVGITENTGFYYAKLSLKYDPDLFVIERDDANAVSNLAIETNTEDYGDKISVSTKTAGTVIITVGGKPFDIYGNPDAPAFEKDGMLIKATFTVKETVAEDVVSLFSLTAHPTDLMVNNMVGFDNLTEGFAKKVAIDDSKNCNIISANHDCGAYEPAVDAAVPADCLNTGLTEGSHCSVCYEVLVEQKVTEALGHTGGQATCIALAVCERCGVSYGEMLDHTWTWVVDVEATFETTGLKHQECTTEGCTAVQNENTVIEVVTCTHEMVKTEKVETTCETDGMQEYWTCSICERIYSDEAGQLQTTLDELKITTDGHKSEKIEGTDATCTTTGLTDGEKCSVCGVILVKQEVTPVIDHTKEVLPAVSATCAATGLTEGLKCSVCGEILVEQKTTEKLTHKYGEWEVSKKATTKAPGEEKRVCADCGEIDTREIPQKDPLISTPVLIALIVAGVAAVALVAVLVIRKKKLLHR